MPNYTIASNRWRFGTFSWQGQAPQYDQLGQPGEIVYRRYVEDIANSSVMMGTPVDTLLYYDEHGHLAAILNHYPAGAIEKDGNQLEAPGNVNTIIRPDAPETREVLIAEARRRWPTCNDEIVIGMGPNALRGTVTIPVSLGGGIQDGNRRISHTSALNK